MKTTGKQSEYKKSVQTTTELTKQGKNSTFE